MKKLVGSLLSLLAVVLIGGFAAAALVRFSPGFDVDENSWNPKISAATREVLHARRARDNRLPEFYLHYLQAALHGDLGQSDSLKAPVTELLRERAPVTVRLIAAGTAGGLLLGGLLAWVAVWPRRAGTEIAATTISGLLMAIPPAVLALAFFFSESPLWLAIAVVLLPRVFGTMRALLDQLYSSSALLAARARGAGPAVLAWRYVALPALPQFMALAGVTLALGFGAIIPIEALCDVPGVGQLFWKAALARDLTLLCGLGLIITFVIAAVQSATDLVAGDR